MLLRRLVAAMLSVALTVLGASVAYGQAPSTGSGQAYPSKPIRIITTTAGSNNDFMTRQIAQGISGPLGQPVIVDNRAALIATDTVAKAASDGYLLLVQGATLWITPLLREAPYDVLRDFSPISLVSRQAALLAVHPSLPVKTVKDLIALAKSRPGELNYAMTSIGGQAHLAAELFKSMAGVNIVRVSYKGQAPSLAGLLNGEVHMAITDVGLLMPNVKAGKLRAVAVTSSEPSALTPGVPTVAASGLPGYEMVGITGSFTTAKTPAPIINRLNQEFARVLARSDVKESFLISGSESVGGSPDQLVAAIKTEVAKLSKVIKDAGIKAD